MAPCAAPACPLTVIAWRLGALPVGDLWWRYAELGGQHPRAALAGYLTGAEAWPDAEHNILAQTLNEILWDRGLPGLAPPRACVPAPRAAGPRAGTELRPEDRGVGW